jgi:hypothetical protein
MQIRLSFLKKAYLRRLAAEFFIKMELWRATWECNGFTAPIWFCSFSFPEKKTNQKKPPSPRGPAGCPALLAAGGPCGTLLRSDSHRAFFAGCCDALPGTMGQKTPAKKPG